jgi:hypothetical protein
MQRAFLATLLFLGARVVCGQALVEVDPTGQIPRDGFKTWSLFLVCNQDWVSLEKTQDLSNLYWRFKGFGDAIGKDNLAVWFWKKKMPITNPRLAENVDVPRSVEYCTALNRMRPSSAKPLLPSASPFLVVTSAYPDVAAFPTERAIFELGRLNAAELATLLGDVTNQLVVEGKVDAARLALSPTPAVPAPPPLPNLWIRLLESTRRSMIGLGCKLKLSIDTGLFSAELRECAGP